MAWRRWAERLLCVAAGVGVCWFAMHDPMGSSVDERIRRMRGRKFLVIGYDPDQKAPWHYHAGSRGTRGEAAEDWYTMTYRTQEDVEATTRRAFPFIPTISVEPIR